MFKPNAGRFLFRLWILYTLNELFLKLRSVNENDKNRNRKKPTDTIAANMLFIAIPFLLVASSSAFPTGKSFILLHSILPNL